MGQNNIKATNMRKIILLFLAFFSLAINAQIYTHKRVLDKFDDAVFDKDVKTLIQKTDSTFIIEEKGHTPVIYRIINYAGYNSMGDKDNIVNLVDNVYGYQASWYCVSETDYPNYIKDYAACVIEQDETRRKAAIANMVEKYGYIIVDRVITTQYSKQYTAELLWVQKGDNNGRTIYSKW